MVSGSATLRHLDCRITHNLYVPSLYAWKRRPCWNLYAVTLEVRDVVKLCLGSMSADSQAPLWRITARILVVAICRVVGIQSCVDLDVAGLGRDSGRLVWSWYCHCDASGWYSLRRSETAAACGDKKDEQAAWLLGRCDAELHLQRPALRARDEPGVRGTSPCSSSSPSTTSNQPPRLLFIGCSQVHSLFPRRGCLVELLAGCCGQYGLWRRSSLKRAAGIQMG